MKKLLVLVMAVLLVLSAVPAATFAIDKNDKEFDAFLKEINWSKKDYLKYLESKEWPLEYFDDVDELGTPLSEKGVQTIMADFGMTRAELNKLFTDFGDIEEGQDVLDGELIIFDEELYYYTEFYLSVGIDENDPEFLAFLKKIGWSKKDYLAYLDSKGWSLEDFWFADELGTPLSEKGVQAVMKDFNLTRAELNALLVENYDIDKGEDVLDGTIIIFNEDLYDWVEFYIFYEDIDLDGMDIFTEIGLTDEELERLVEHFMTLNFADEAFLAQLESLLERMILIEDFESADDLDAAQVAELLDIFSQMMNLFEIEAKYYLTNGKEKQLLSLSALMTLETTNGMDLLIEIYNTEGKFLLDAIFTAEMFGSEIIKDTGKDLETVKDVVTAPKPVKVKKEVKTVKGGKLPKTASDYGVNALIGLSIVLIGLLLFRRLKTVGN